MKDHDRCSIYEQYYEIDWVKKRISLQVNKNLGLLHHYHSNISLTKASVTSRTRFVGYCQTGI